LLPRYHDMFRLLLLAAALWILWRIFKGFRIHIERLQTPPTETFEPMGRCAKCGIHTPAETLNKSGVCGRCAE
jgi:hypothetical protein